MVAYNFQQRFEAQIRDCLKMQTIRAKGARRHARVGDLIQLYTGMRTAGCRKIRPDVRCLSADDITLWFDVDGMIERITVADELVADLGETGKLRAFAKSDGFESTADMSAFWQAQHGPLTFAQFRGVLIRWAAGSEVTP